MQYVAVVQGVERQVEITAQGADGFTVHVDGVRFELTAQQIDASTLSVVAADAQAWAAGLTLDPATQDVLSVDVHGHNVPVAVYDLRRQALRQAQQSVQTADGPADVASPMAGKVVAVLVEEGQAVEQGQGLVVVEAMKMENELRAPKAGTIRRLKAEVGAAVDGGLALCVVE
jgi:biotin carboxyl carrier protein